MKKILEFNMPDDDEEFALANKALDLHTAAWDFGNFLRSQVKYANLPDKEQKIYEEVQSKFWEHFGDLLNG